MKTTPAAEEFLPKPERSRNVNRLTFKPPLAVRDGVSPSYIWLPPGTWINLLSFLVERFPNVSRDAWQLRMHRGDVVNAHGTRMEADSPYRSNDCIFYYREPEPETAIPFAEHIVYQDEDILVSDKPHFLPVIPSGRFLRETLLVRLKRRTGLDHLTPIHRIDRETAGLVVFSHNVRTRGAYQSLFQKREVEKVYHAVAANLNGVQFPFVYRSRLVEGQPFFRMAEVDGEPNSETHIDIADRGKHWSRYLLRPVTGKKHQLRVHLAALGIPIINDAFYPDALPCKGDDMSQPLQLLAKAIAFRDPVSGKAHYFESKRELALPHE